jgi:hypothetical protein
MPGPATFTTALVRLRPQHAHVRADDRAVAGARCSCTQISSFEFSDVPRLVADLHCDALAAGRCNAPDRRRGNSAAARLDLSRAPPNSAHARRGATNDSRFMSVSNAIRVRSSFSTRAYSMSAETDITVKNCVHNPCRSGAA